MFLRKNKKTSTSDRISLSHVVSKQLHLLQRKWAFWMQRKSRHWTKCQQKTFMFLLCLIVGGSSTSSLLSFFRQHNSRQSSYVSIPAPLPLVPFNYPPSSPANQNNLDTAVFTQFRKQLDSMKQTKCGRKTIDSFLRARPGFLDSLAFAEKSAHTIISHK